MLIWNATFLASVKVLVAVAREKSILMHAATTAMAKAIIPRIVNNHRSVLAVGLLNIGSQIVRSVAQNPRILSGLPRCLRCALISHQKILGFFKVFLSFTRVLKLHLFLILFPLRQPLESYPEYRNGWLWWWGLWRGKSKL